MRPATPRPRRSLPLARAAAACAVAVWISVGTACAPAPARPSASPTAPARRPEDPFLAQLTQMLRLDAAQQERTRQLIAELYERDARIREKWDQGGRIHPEELLGSHGIFERDFLALLTDEQRRVFAEQRLKAQRGAIPGAGRRP